MRNRKVIFLININLRKYPWMQRIKRVNLNLNLNRNRIEKRRIKIKETRKVKLKVKKVKIKLTQMAMVKVIKIKVKLKRRIINKTRKSKDIPAPIEKEHDNPQTPTTSNEANKESLTPKIPGAGNNFDKETPDQISVTNDKHEIDHLPDNEHETEQIIQPMMNLKMIVQQIMQFHQMMI